MSPLVFERCVSPSSNYRNPHVYSARKPDTDFTFLSLREEMLIRTNVRPRRHGHRLLTLYPHALATLVRAVPAHAAEPSGTRPATSWDPSPVESEYRRRRLRRVFSFFLVTSSHSRTTELHRIHKGPNTKDGPCICTDALCWRLV